RARCRHRRRSGTSGRSRLRGCSSHRLAPAEAVEVCDRGTHHVGGIPGVPEQPVTLATQQPPRLTRVMVVVDGRSHVPGTIDLETKTTNGACAALLGERRVEPFLRDAIALLGVTLTKDCWVCETLSALHRLDSFIRSRL